MAIIQESDFVNEYKIPTDNFSNLDSYIVRYENYYLVRLLGANLYDLFIADLTPSTPQTPQSARFDVIFKSFEIDDNECLRISQGMKIMLRQFIYFHYTRDQVNQPSQTGHVQNTNSNSTPARFKGFNLVQAYNEGVKNFNEIQWYIRDNDTDYPEENMQFIQTISGI